VEKRLVQIIDGFTGKFVGVYSVPDDKREQFFAEIEKAESQSEFDEDNTLGVKRVFIDEEVLEIKF